jgi:hypothetical protein
MRCILCRVIRNDLFLISHNQEYEMSIKNIIASASLSLAIMCGAIAITPSSVQAGGKKVIDYAALKKGNNAGSKNKWNPAKPYNRGCSAIARCHRS